MRTVFLTACFALFGSTSGLAFEEPHPSPVVETSADLDGRDPTKPSLRIQTRIDNGAWSSRRAISPLKGQRVTLRTKPVEGGDPRWFAIFADLTRNYANANTPWEEDPYEWRGVEEIGYARVEIPSGRGRWEISPFDEMETVLEALLKRLGSENRDERTFSFYRSDAGTFWFQVEVETDGRLLRSHGIEDRGPRGLSRKVTRVTVRDGEGLTGHVTGFYNVPGVFGSLLSQSVNRVGADCADVLMAAWSSWKKRKLTKNHNVQMMVTRFEKRATISMEGGVADEELKWGVDVHPGDFIAVHYGEEGRKYHHVGALWSDADGDGVLGSGDLVIHAGPYPLHLSRLDRRVFDGRVVILSP